MSMPVPDVTTLLNQVKAGHEVITSSLHRPARAPRALRGASQGQFDRFSSFFAGPITADSAKYGTVSFPFGWRAERGPRDYSISQACCLPVERSSGNFANVSVFEPGPPGLLRRDQGGTPGPAFPSSRADSSNFRLFI
jgi:hypothetical protein